MVLRMPNDKQTIEPSYDILASLLKGIRQTVIYTLILFFRVSDRSHPVELGVKIATSYCFASGPSSFSFLLSSFLPLMASMSSWVSIFLFFGIEPGIRRSMNFSK
jgi:hypothetical protein